MDFKKYLALTEQNTVGYHNDGVSGHGKQSGAMVSAAWAGTDSELWRGTFGDRAQPPQVAMLMAKMGDVPDVNHMRVEKRGIIRYIDRNESNIPIMLSDGTHLHLTYDEFKRIQGCKPEPQIGDELSVTFLRNPADKSDSLAQVQSCKCRRR